MCGGTLGVTENDRIRVASELRLSAGGRGSDGVRVSSHLLLVEEGGISGAQAYKTISRRGARG